MPPIWFCPIPFDAPPFNCGAPEEEGKMRFRYKHIFYRRAYDAVRELTTHVRIISASCACEQLSEHQTPPDLQKLEPGFDC
jgi:hypothetical protein